MKKGKIEKVLPLAVSGGLGMLGANLARNNVEFLRQNSTMTNAIFLAAGVFAATQKNEYVQGAGIGVAAASIADLAETFTNASGTASRVAAPRRIAGTGDYTYKRQIAGTQRRPVASARMRV